MNKKFTYSLLLILLIIVGCQNDSTELIETEVLIEVVSFAKPQPIPGSYIIVYNDIAGKIAPLTKSKSKEDYRTQIRNLKTTFVNEFATINLKEENITATYGFALKGFAAKLTKEQVNTLKKDPRVKSIEQDFIISISPFKGKPVKEEDSPPGEETPYGTTRVGGGTTTSSFTAWVIDTGIDLDHPDLNVEPNDEDTRNISFVRGGPNDQNGHGTHVAGTIAAIDNEIGSVGVAPNTLVVAVRVLDRRGRGTISGVIAGIDYVGANGNSGDVANMSLGGGVSQTLDDAVIKASEPTKGNSEGIKFSLAAGNSAKDANNYSPARANGDNIYTISAMDSNDDWAYFSNYGNPPIDYCAPGVAVFSLWKDGGYKTISGTSMAAPHAAGVLLLVSPTTDGYVIDDPDLDSEGKGDPIIHTGIK
ncbi:MAG: S8 family peptidase [Bacteroidetes bacterium]|nr:S8 family peptidase [Bacteroidota bacterium]